MLFRDDRRHLNTESDSEILLNVFAHELQRTGSLEVDERDVFKAVSAVHRRCRGGYANVAMIAGYGIVGFRIPSEFARWCLVDASPTRVRNI